MSTSHYITPNTALELASILPAALEALYVPNKSLNTKTRDLNLVLQLSLDSPLKPRKINWLHGSQRKPALSKSPLEN